MKRFIKIKRALRISWSLARANFNLRIEGSYLGILWYLLSPLALFSIIIFIKKSAFIDSSINNYSAYLLIGITGLHFFQQAISNSIDSIKNQSSYIKSINNLDSEVLVISSVFQAALSHIFELAMLVVFLIIWGLPLWGLLLYPFLLFFFLLLILGLAFLFSTISVYIRDFSNIWSVISQLLLLFTPIFYVVKPGSLVYSLNLFNPLFYFLGLFRDLFIYPNHWPLISIAVFIFLSVVIFSLGLFVFNKNKVKFAELI